MLHFIHAGFDSPELVQAVCRTLLHSLWQGVLLVLLAETTMVLARKASAQLRYNLLLLLLGAFVACISLTFAQQWRLAWENTTANSQPMADTAVGEIDAFAELLAGPPTVSQAFQDRVVGFFHRFDTYSSWIVSLWLLVLCLKCARMGLGIWYMGRVLRFRSKLPQQSWGHRLQALARQIGLRQRIDLLESALVQVPSTLGFFKPVVLLPLGLLAQLPPEQVEAILLHELAHIRRRDYFVNFLQCLLETVFFFNPGLWWVSGRIREEREHCCDDIAVGALNNKTHYINALVAFQELTLGNTAPVLAFSGRKMHLLERVTRILNQQHTKTLSIMEKISLIASILIIAVLSFFPFGNTTAQNDAKGNHNIRQMSVLGAGTTADPEVILVQEDKGQVVVAKRVDKKVVEMYVNGEKIEAARYAEFDALLAHVDETIARDKKQAELDAQQAKLDEEQAKRDAEQAKRDARQAKLDAEQAAKDQEMARQDAKQAKRDAEQAELDAQQGQRDAKQAGKDREQATRDREQAMRDREQAMRDREQAVRDAQQAKLDAEQAVRDAEQAKLDAEQAVRDAEQAKRDAEQAVRDRKQAEEDRRISKLIVASLVSDKIIANSADFKSLILSDTDLIVNGKRQEDALLKKYKSKYLHSPGQILSFSHNPGKRAE